LISYTIDVNPDLSNITNACSEAERIVAIQIMKDTRPYVPALTMSLNQRTRTLGKSIIYPGPYARYLWFGKRMVDSKTGRGPFYIEEVGWRYKKGAKLVPTEKPLNYTTSVHAKAGSHWVDRSFTDNKDKWLRVAKEAIDRYGR